MKILGILAALLGLALALLFLWGGERTGREGPAPRLELAAEEGPDAPASTRSAAPTAPTAQSVETGGAGRTVAREAANPAGTETQPARTLLGLVVGEGAPVRGASVELFAHGQPLVRVNTTRTGTFELTFLVPQDDLALRVEADGFAPLELDLGSQRIVGQQRLGNLFLQQGSLLSGSVVDAAGRAVADAEVSLTTLRGFVSLGTGVTTRSASDGRFAFPLAPNGVVVLSARAPGYADLRLEHRHGRDRDALLELVPGADVVVRVMDTEERPIAGMTVVLRPDPPGLQLREAHTNDSGEASFSGLAARSWAVRVSGPGFKPSGGTTVDAEGGEVVVRLVPWPSVEGRVLDPEGEPAPPETRVHAVPNASRGDLLGRLSGGTPIGDGGRYRISDLRPGEYKVVALAPDFAVTSSSPFLVGDVEDVRLSDLVLLEAGTILLELRAGGEALAGVLGEIHAAPPLPAQVWSVPTDVQRLVASDREGTLRFSGLSAGNAWIVLRGDGLIAEVVGPLPVASGQTTAPSPIELQTGSSIQGRVTTTGGVAVARARVHVSGNVASIPFLQTEEDGTFRTPALPSGTYVIEATSVVSGELFEAAPLEIRLRPGSDAEAVLVLEGDSS